MRGLTKDEARKLVEWKNAVFQNALDTVIKEVNSKWAPYSKYMVTRQSGKRGIVFDAMISAAVKYMEENMSQHEKQTYMIAQDYEDILMADEESGGGFNSMSEAYVAGVPIEDILA